MNRCFIPLPLSRYYSRQRRRRNRSISLLLQASLAPDDRAVRAWRDWLQVRCLADTTWSEARLLAPLAPRIASLDPGSPLRARLEGLAKAHWTQTQVVIRDSASALDVLANIGIRCLLLKGAAYYAEGLAPARRRIMADVDILVPPDAVIMASNRLREAGWSGTWGGALVRDDACPSENYLKGKFGDIDLHRHAFHFCRRDLELDVALWENARPARLAGRCVLMPSVADSIVISVAHGIGNGDGDWAIDVDCSVRKHPVDWDRVAHIADRRGLIPHVLAGLTYLKTLGSDIPQLALDHLRKASPTLGEYLKYFRDIAPAKLKEGTNRIANRLLPRDQYQYRW